MRELDSSSFDKEFIFQDLHPQLNKEEVRSPELLYHKMGSGAYYLSFISDGTH